MPSNPRRRTKTPIRVLVVAPDSMTAELLAAAFSRGRDGFSVTNLIGTSDNAIQQLTSCKSDVALISEDLQDGPQAGFKILRELSVSNQAAAIMLLKSSRPESVVYAFREGARGVLHRNTSAAALSKCIRMVHLGQFWLGNADIQHLVGALHQRKPLRIAEAGKAPPLTRREEDVVRLVVDGMGNREIAKHLGLTPNSIRNYLYRIFEKMGVSSRVELILYVLSRTDEPN